MLHYKKIYEEFQARLKVENAHSTLCRCGACPLLEDAPKKRSPPARKPKAVRTVARLRVVGHVPAEEVWTVVEAPASMASLMRSVKKRESQSNASGESRTRD